MRKGSGFPRTPIWLEQELLTFCEKETILISLQRSESSDWAADSKEHKSWALAALLALLERRYWCQRTYLPYTGRYGIKGKVTVWSIYLIMLWNYQGLLATKPKYPLNETYSPSWNQPPTLYYPPPSLWNSHLPCPTFFYNSCDKLIHYIICISVMHNDCCLFPPLI